MADNRGYERQGSSARCENALRKDGWTITDDPLKVVWKERKLNVDLGAEKVIAAEKENRKIAVEIKSFLSQNDLEDLYHSLGQYILYRKALRKDDPLRTLFLAIDRQVFLQLFDDSEGESLRAEEGVNLLVFDKRTEEIVLWKE